MGTSKHELFSFPHGTRLDQVEPAQSEAGEKGAPDSQIRHNLVSPKQSNNKNGVSKMDVMKMLGELKQEREHIEEAILTLERLARGRGKRRGRPPSWMKELKRRGRPPGSKNKSKESSAA
jgi:hypothetical protein